MYVGVDIGATKTLIAFENFNGEFIEQKTFATSPDFDTFIEDIKTHMNDCVQNQNEPLNGVVVAAPGTIEKGILRAGGNVSWQNVDILDHLHPIYGNIPDDILNDAAAAGLYEATCGAGREHNLVLYVTIGTGIGTSIVTDGTLDYNFANSEGGRTVVGWQTGLTFENIASGQAFVEQYGHRGASETDPHVWSEYGRAVATGIFSMITVVRPSIVVIGGSMGEHFSKYHEAMREQIAQYAGELFTPPDVVAATKPTTAVSHGCIVRAKEIARG